MKPINTLYEQNCAELLNIQVGDTYTYHKTLKD
jgi:hypothetical protein